MVPPFTLIQGKNTKQRYVHFQRNTDNHLPLPQAKSSTINLKSVFPLAAAKICVKNRQNIIL